MRLQNSIFPPGETQLLGWGEGQAWGSSGVPGHRYLLPGHTDPLAGLSATPAESLPRAGREGAEIWHVGRMT